MPSVVAIVLNFNGGATTLRCVQHLLEQVPHAPEILVVDNASTDNSIALLADCASRIRVLRLPTNRGFAGGMNAGLSAAIEEDYDFAWLVNNDVFAKPGCLFHLVAAFADKTVAAAGPRLLNTDGSEQHVGGRVTDWATGDNELLSAIDLDIAKADQWVDGTWLTGAAPLIRVSALKDVGIFEDAFFAYWEDVDLSVRLSRKGWSQGVVRQAEAVHLGGATSGGSESPLAVHLEIRNRWLFLTRNAQKGSALARWLRFSSMVIRRAAQNDAIGRASIAAALLSGLSEARTNHYFAPSGTGSPLAYERLCRMYPWKLSGAFNRLAAAFDRVR